MNDLQDILQSHIKESREHQNKVIEKLSAIETHNQYTHERLDRVEAISDDYKKHKNRLYGAIVVLSSIFGFIASWIKEQMK